MKTIYKYSLDPADTQLIGMPEGAVILSVAEQRDQPVVYALVDPDEKKIEYVEFRVVGTGNDASKLEGFDFLGTVPIAKGLYVFHIFFKQGETE